VPIASSDAGPVAARAEDCWDETAEAEERCVQVEANFARPGVPQAERCAPWAGAAALEQTAVRAGEAMDSGSPGAGLASSCPHRGDMWGSGSGRAGLARWCPRRGGTEAVGSPEVDLAQRCPPGGDRTDFDSRAADLE
jgi:hypothetical protein